MKNEMKQLQENNIDITHLVEFRADHCKQFEFSKERQSCD
jgi:hypothetical protein